VSRLLGCDWRPVVPRVQDPDMSLHCYVLSRVFYAFCIYDFHPQTLSSTNELALDRREWSLGIHVPKP
jgi:hypothetical protein